MKCSSCGGWMTIMGQRITVPYAYICSNCGNITYL